MSSAAIKDVTRGLQALLVSQLKTVSTTAQVSLLPPGEALPGGLGVNLYLYRITESPFTKNQPWPGDRATPPSSSPPLGLELSYLLTPYAPAPDPSSAAGDDAHAMLGAAMVALHENPILNNVHISGFDADAVLTPALLNSFEQIKIRLATTSLEELSKIWATINQPYRLSVAYDVSLVELTPTAAPPVNGANVARTGLEILPWTAPTLDNLTPGVGPLAHVDGSGSLDSNPLTLSGAGFLFAGQTPAVQFGGQPAPVSASPAPTDASLTVSLPLDSDAGPETNVQVFVNGRASVPVPFIVSPWLAQIVPIRTGMGPGSPPAATILTLTGQGFTNTPQGVRFDGPGGTTNAPVGSASDTQVQVTIPSTLANGIFHVRVVLADVGHSVSNSRTLQIVPLLTAPVGLAQVAVNGNQVHQLTLNGNRLNGSDVRVLIDGIAYAVTPANVQANRLVLTLGKLLASGEHAVAALVDGNQSHTVTLEVP